MRFVAAILITAALSLPARGDDIADALADYFAFASYADGVITPEQLTPDILEQAVFIDARSSAAFAESGLEGAVNIEWRETVDRLEDYPAGGLVVVYCDTSVLSTQAMLAARLLGRQNVVVLQGGLAAWQAHHD